MRGSARQRLPRSDKVRSLLPNLCHWQQTSSMRILRAHSLSFASSYCIAHAAEYARHTVQCAGKVGSGTLPATQGSIPNRCGPFPVYCNVHVSHNLFVDFLCISSGCVRVKYRAHIVVRKVSEGCLGCFTHMRIYVAHVNMSC